MVKLEEEPLRVADAPADLRDDKHFMITALQLFVRRYGDRHWKHFNNEVLQFASPRLCADKELVAIALDQTFRNIRWADATLRDDKEFVLAFMRKCTTRDKMLCVYDSLSDRLRRDVDVGCAFIQYRTIIKYNNIEWAEDKLKWLDASLLENRDFLMHVATCDPLALEYMPAAAQDDADIVRTVILYDHLGVAFQFASERLRSDHDMIMYAVRFGVYVIKHALSNKLEHILEAVTYHGRALKLVELWKGHADVVMTAVRQNPSALQYASKHRRRDKEIIRVAVDGDRKAIAYALGVKSRRVPPFKFDPEWERCGPVQTRLLLLWTGFPPELCNCIAQRVPHARMDSEAGEMWVKRYTH